MVKALRNGFHVSGDVSRTAWRHSRPGGRKTVPLALKLWSSRSPGFGKWVRTAADTIAKAPDAPAIQLLPGFAEFFDTDDG